MAKRLSNLIDLELITRKLKVKIRVDACIKLLSNYEKHLNAAATITFPLLLRGGRNKNVMSLTTVS